MLAAKRVCHPEGGELSCLPALFARRISCLRRPSPTGGRCPKDGRGNISFAFILPLPPVEHLPPVGEGLLKQEILRAKSAGRHDSSPPSR